MAVVFLGLVGANMNMSYSFSNEPLKEMKTPEWMMMNEVDRSVNSGGRGLMTFLVALRTLPIRVLVQYRRKFESESENDFYKL